MVLVLASLSGCGDDDGTPSPGGGTDAGVDAGPAPIAVLPALPDIAPCPDGWREIDGMPATCEPWPESDRAECALGETHWPGTPGCAPVGAACPAGDYPEDLPAGAPVAYVRPGGTGTGTMDDPYGSITAAVRGSARGTVIALAKGTYDAPHRLPAGVTVIGACATETVLVNTVAATAPVVSVDGDGGVLRNVRVGPSGAGGIWAVSGGSFELDGVVVDGTTQFAVLLVGAQLVARQLVVSNTALLAPMMIARGLVAQDGATAELRQSAFLSTPDIGVQVLSGARVTVEDTVIAGTGEGFPGGAGDGIADSVAVFAAGGADVTLRRVVIEDSYDEGIAAVGTDVTMRIESSVIRDHVPPEEGGRGGSALLAEAASVTLTKTVVSRTHDLAVVGEDGAHLVLTDVIIRDTRPDLAGDIEGRGFELHTESSGEVTRALLAGNLETSMFLEGGSAMLEDVTITGTRPAEGSGLGGRGLEVQDGAVVTIRRLHVIDNRDVGFFVGGAGAQVEAEDVTVEHTASDAARDNGIGLVVQDGAFMAATRVRLADNHSAALMTYYPGARVELREAEIADTLERECAADSCAGNGSGTGVVAVDSASALVEDFTIAGSALCGVLVANGGTADLARGEVRENLVGACVQTESFDFMRLSNDVRYVDNETNLDSTSLPVPEPVAPTS